jgi:hypothetical protein
MQKPAVIRRRLVEAKNCKRQEAAVNRKRGGDGKFGSGPKRIFRVYKVASPLEKQLRKEKRRTER